MLKGFLKFVILLDIYRIQSIDCSAVTAGDLLWAVGMKLNFEKGSAGSHVTTHIHILLIIMLNAHIGLSE